MASRNVTESDHQVSRGGKRRELDREALEALLAALAPDREAAGRKYEDLRRRLTNLFAWEHCAAPDSLADETLNRLARKVLQGVEIPNFDRFAFGIARLVMQEEIRASRDRQKAIREMQAARTNPSDWATLDALQKCLDALPADRRELVEKYYSEDRAALARRQGISLNALRNRVMRIREDLFRCLSRRRDEY